MVYRAAADVDGGITLDETGAQMLCVEKALTAAIDIADGGAASFNSRVAYLTTCDGNVRIGIHAAQFTATVDALLHVAAIHDNRCVVDNSLKTQTGTEDVACYHGSLHRLWCAVAQVDGCAHCGTHGYILFCTDIDLGVAEDIGSTTATIDITDGTYLVLYLAADGILVYDCYVLDIGDGFICFGQINSLVQSGLVALNHVDIHGGAAMHNSRCTQSAAEHISDAGAGNDVQHGVGIRQTQCRLLVIREFIKLCLCSGHQHASHILVSVYGVGSVLAAEIEVVNHEGVATRLLDGDGDGALNGTAGIVTAKDAQEVSAGDNQIHPTLHVCVAGATIDIVHVVHATQYQAYRTILFCLVASAVDFLNLTNVAAVIFGIEWVFLWHRDGCTATHITQSVTAAEDIVDMTTDEFGDCLTRAVFSGSVVVETDVGTWVAESFTITAAKHIIYNIGTEDGHIRCRYGRSITAAIDVFDACFVTTFDDDLGEGLISYVLVSADCFGGHIVCLVAAAIDGCNVVGRTLYACLGQSGSGRLVAVHCALDVYLHMSLRCAVQVVTSEYLSRDGRTVVAFASVVAHKLDTVEQHIDITAHDGFDARLCWFDRWFLTQSATEDVAMNGAAIEVDVCCLVGIDDELAAGVPVCIHVS